MSEIKLSVIIPSYKDPLLIKTIDSLLTSSELGKSFEIVAVLDGYWPDFDLRDDPRVRYVHLGSNSGMREAINAGVKISRGEFIVRSDEHCLFAQGWDKEMTDSCQPNWIMTSTRYFLDPVKWEVMDIPPVIYEKLVIQEEKKFSGQRWRERDKQRKHKQIDKTMAMQGSVWLMSRKWWDDVIGELQTEGYGPHYQDSHEIIFATWQAGGEMMVNKNTWFAHKHRSFKRSHQEGTPENPANREASWKYSLDIWREYYEEVIRKRWGI